MLSARWHIVISFLLPQLRYFSLSHALPSFHVHTLMSVLLVFKNKYNGENKIEHGYESEHGNGQIPHLPKRKRKHTCTCKCSKKKSSFILYFSIQELFILSLPLSFFFQKKKKNEGK